LHLSLKAEEFQGSTGRAEGKAERRQQREVQQVSALQDALQKISELEKAIENLNQELIEARRRNITRI
jgi:hypothetical protein